jgi:hypothetical protein
MTHFPERIYDMRGNNSGLYRVAVVRCAACNKEWGDGSWPEGMKGYEQAHQDLPSAALKQFETDRLNRAVGPDY